VLVVGLTLFCTKFSRLKSVCSFVPSYWYRIAATKPTLAIINTLFFIHEQWTSKQDVKNAVETGDFDDKTCIDDDCGVNEQNYVLS